jgi:alcohol dehydrogenase class IV
MLTADAPFAPDLILSRLGLHRTVFGRDVSSALAEAIGRLSAHRVLLVRDRVAVDACGISDQLVGCLSVDSDCGVVDIHATLAPAEADRWGAWCAEGGYDCVVAVGGGATIDAAKLICLSASNARSLDEMLGGEFSPNRIPIIAAPTTAGSGSEATHFAVLFRDGEKFSVADASLLPQWAIVDPTLTHRVPQRVAVAAGLDVLCQSVESLWSIHADEKSLEFAGEALRLAVPSLHRAVIGREAEAQAMLALASHLAGQAINRGFTTVCHALSYVLTAKYGVPHGLAAAATLPAALLFNCSPTSQGELRAGEERRGPAPRDVLLRVLETRDIDSASRRLVELIRSIGGAASVSELRLPTEYQPREHAESIDPHRLKNNPRPVSIEDSLGLLLTSFDENGRVVGRR